MDSNEQDKMKPTGFKHGQLVWAKKPLSPWFPGIVCFQISFFLCKINQ